MQFRDSVNGRVVSLENVLFDFSSAVLQILRYGGMEADVGAFLDMDVSWSQFVSGVFGFVAPSEANIVTVNLSVH